VTTCATCGSPNEAEAVFCGTCGALLATPEVLDETAPVVVPSLPDRAPDPTPVPDAPLPDAPLPDPPLPDPTPIQTFPITKSAVTPEGITCPACGTSNPIGRAVCIKCATELNPAAPVKPPRINRRFLAGFLFSAVLGTAVVVGGAMVLTRFSAASAAEATPPPPVAVTDQSGVETEVGLEPGTDPKPLEQLPVEASVQLASYDEAAQETPTPDAPVRARWWNDAVPRIPAISQFDGGPLEGVNCVMASGAMLARLAYGIVTTGSQLRALSRDPEGPTSFQDLQNAMYAGWGVKFSMGAASALQFRALLYAGAGAEIVVDYGAIPASVRLSPNFTGNHAIYIDAFRPAGVEGSTEDAYYVMDPIGHTWAGYKGEWWSAEMVERAAGSFGRGRIVAAWAFAGDKVPFVHPVLPRSAYPPNTPDASPGPSESAGAGGTLEPGTSIDPGRSIDPGSSSVPGSSSGPIGPGGGGLIDHMPFDDLPLDIDTSVGTEPPDAPKFPGIDFFTDRYQLDSKLTSTRCTVQPLPADCPIGIIGILGTKSLTGTTDAIKLLYADTIGPGTYQIIFESPPDGDSELLLWDTKSGGTLEGARVESGLLDGTSVSIATVTLDPTLDYSFVATSTTDGIRSVSDIGSLLVKS
jgi:hypothetical protein